MGSRDYRHRETKKTKKTKKDTIHGTILSPSTTVEVIKKGKKESKED